MLSHTILLLLLCASIASGCRSTMFIATKRSESANGDVIYTCENSNKPRAIIYDRRYSKVYESIICTQKGWIGVNANTDETGELRDQIGHNRIVIDCYQKCDLAIPEGRDIKLTESPFVEAICTDPDLQMFAVEYRLRRGRAYCIGQLWHAELMVTHDDLECRRDGKAPPRIPVAMNTTTPAQSACTVSNDPDVKHYRHSNFNIVYYVCANTSLQMYYGDKKVKQPRCLPVSGWHDEQGLVTTDTKTPLELECRQDEVPTTKGPGISIDSADPRAPKTVPAVNTTVNRPPQSPNVPNKKPGKGDIAANGREGEESGPSSATLIGCSIGGIFLLVVVAVVIYFCIKNKKNDSETGGEEEDGDKSEILSEINFTTQSEFNT